MPRFQVSAIRMSRVVLCYTYVPLSVHKTLEVDFEILAYKFP